MKLEIEFENQEDLRKKLSSLLSEPVILNIRPCYTVEEIKKRIPVEDAYIFGRELRVLVAPQDLPLLSDWQYKIIEPTMEDVFSYYLDKKGGGKV